VLPGSQKSLAMAERTGMRLAVDTSRRQRRLEPLRGWRVQGSGPVGGRWSNGSVVAVLTAINMWLGVLLSLTGSIAVALQAVPSCGNWLSTTPGR
jgi:hypothetical protein